MATPEQLGLRIWPHKLALGRRVVRNIYIAEPAGGWIHENLKALRPDGFHGDGVELPREQLADVFRRFMVGEDINRFPPKTLVAAPDWLHELRTADLRIFGWFWRRQHYIVAVVMTKKELGDKRVTYHGCLETCKAVRDSLDLEPPKFIEGEINDILRL